MRYAKLINNYPSYAPHRLRIGGAWVYNPTDEQQLAEGFLSVVETEPPETDERHYATPHWSEAGGQIVQSWTVEELSDLAGPEDYEQALEEMGVDFSD